MKSKACIMTFRPFNIPAVYSDDMLARLAEEFDMLPFICSKDDFPALEGELQKVEYIFSTWGMPALSEEEIRRYLPRLKAVFYAAGTVQQFARPLISCGVDIFSAWAANAVPVAEVAASEILLANKGFFRREVKCRADWQNDDRERLYPGNFRTRAGILGAGMIGTMVINHLHRHELEIYVVDPFLPDEKAAELGADALLLVTPYYNKTSQAGLIAHFTAMADAAGIPVILYNVPSRTGLNIAPETALELSKHPLINGIKEASGNISQVAKIAQLCGDELNIYSGNDDQVVPLLSLGGKGVISVVSNVKPELMHDCCKAWFEGDTRKACQLQLEILPLADALFCEVNPIPVKYAMNVLGWNAGACRLPLVEPSDAHKEKIEQALAAEGLLK